MQGETSKLLSLKHLKKISFITRTFTCICDKQKGCEHIWKRKKLATNGTVEVHVFEWRHHFLWGCGLPLAYPMLHVFKTCKSLKHRIKITVDIIEEEVKEQKSYSLDEVHIRYILLDRRAWSLVPLVQVKFGRPKSLWNCFCNLCNY